jgi:hypothetical protein
MTADQTLTEIDTSRWSAYVLGCLPYDVRRRLQVLWVPVRPNGPLPDRRDWAPIPRKLKQMRAALDILSRAGEIEAAPALQLAQALDRFKEACRECIGWVRSTHDRPSDSPCPLLPPGSREWLDVACIVQPPPLRAWPDTVGRPLLRSRELDLWARLGTAVGGWLWYLAPPPNFGDDVPAPARDIPAMLKELIETHGHPFLRSALEVFEMVLEPMTATSLGEQLRWNLARHRRISQQDAEIRAALRQQAPAAPVLVLSRERLELFGESLDLAGGSEEQISCLWLLAEKANAPVRRQGLLEEGNITVRSKVNSLKSIVSRLRDDILRPLIAAYRRRDPGALPHERDAFIVGRNRAWGSHAWGAYMLALPRRLVRVVGERPPWMRPKSQR